MRGAVDPDKLARELIRTRIRRGKDPLGIWEPQIDPAWRDVFAIPGDVAIEHPRLPVRLREAISEVAVCTALRGKAVAVVCPEKGPVANLIERSLEMRAAKKRRSNDRAAILWTFDLGSLWLIDHDGLANPPFEDLDLLLGLSCSQVRRNVASLRATTYLLSGEIAERGHWFYTWARNGKTTRCVLEGDAAVALWPEVARVAPLPSDPLFDRIYHVRDVAPRFTTPNPLTWFRTRLRVKTELPRELLHPIQAREAEAQWGEPIVSFIPRSVQRRYLAAKRSLVRARFDRRSRPPHFLLLKYRQGGFTTVEQALSYMRCATRPNTEVLTLANTAAKTQQIFEMVRRFAEHDPKPLRIVDDNQGLLRFDNGSAFYLSTAGSTGSSRGLTKQKVHWSEVAWSCPGPRHNLLITEQINGLLNTAQHGEVVLETTPNGLERFAELYKEAKDGNQDWIPIFLRWFDDPANRLPTSLFNAEEVEAAMDDRERELARRHKLDIAQIAFRQSKHRKFGVFALQEYPEDDVSCFIVSGTCYFDSRKCLDIMDALPLVDPAEQEKQGGKCWFWEAPKTGRKYVLGADCAEGVPKGDLTCIGILDRETGEQVAAAHGHFDPRATADLIVTMANLYNNALVGIERENHGHAVLQRVREAEGFRPHFRGGNLYFYDRAEDPRKAKAGWSTNPETRPRMLADLAEALVTGALKVKHRAFVDEMLTFRRQPSGRFEADSGRHDDAVMAWAIAWQMRNYARPTGSISIA